MSTPQSLPPSATSSATAAQFIAESAAPSTPTAVPSAARPRSRSRTSSITESFLNSRPPLGSLAATGGAVGSAPSWGDLRRNSTSSNARRASVGRRGSEVSGAGTGASSLGRWSSLSSYTGGKADPSSVGDRRISSIPIAERRSEDVTRPAQTLSTAADVEGIEEKRSKITAPAPERLEQADGYNGTGEGVEEEEGKSNWWVTTKHGLFVFWKWFLTPLGFCITIYMLNVVAWGGMLFLLLCNAAPAMCHPTCNDINSPRRIWIEIDSQILNALFCVTGFGLIPWRFRDLYYLLKWRWFGKKSGYLKLQEINQAWYRQAPATSSVENGEDQMVAKQQGQSNGNADTVTGKRAPPTKSWKLDYVIWLYVWNTFFQCCLSGFMWGLNRHTRPSWDTGLFVALACIVAGLAGGQVWWETRRVKKIEGDKKKEEEKQQQAEREAAEGKREVEANGNNPVV